MQESGRDQGKVMGAHGMDRVLNKKFLCAGQKVIKFIAVVRMGFGHTETAVSPQLVYKKQRRIICEFFIVWIHFNIAFPKYI
ncbi:MAG: hypothetical protein RHS_3686 [Robinsoniella sp. RHS]|nr:MAG: hypothetical protein RHS_3686 [Robinsoniella sp. RHS]